MDDLPLRDIHLPQPIGWWPLAPGWWLALFLLLASLGLALWLRRRRKRYSLLKIANLQLAALREHGDDAQAILKQLSQLLRRIAISYYPRQAVAGLSGEAWLAFLDRGFDDAPFSNGVGRCLLDGPYRAASAEPPDLQALFALCERWIALQTESAS
jgi:Domain of unknown function (DUF4381)